MGEEDEAGATGRDETAAAAGRTGRRVMEACKASSWRAGEPFVGDRTLSVGIVAGKWNWPVKETMESIEING